MQASDMTAHLDSLGVPYRYLGSADTAFTGYCTLKEPQDGCITWIKHGNEPLLNDVPADLRLLIVADERGADMLPLSGRNILLCSDPKAVFFDAVDRFFVHSRQCTGISPHAVVETDQIGKNVSIGPFCHICPGTVIGDGVTIHSSVSIDCPTVIGKGSVIWSGVRIGTDGFGYYDGLSGHKQQVPHTGGVEIGTYVEIGANTCIDRGTIGNTRIGDHVKIDNLCHIGHNAVIDNDCLVIAFTMVGGSAHIKQHGYTAPGVCIMNQVTVGEHCLLGMGAVVLHDVPDNKIMAGVPAKEIRDNL